MIKVELYAARCRMPTTIMMICKLEKLTSNQKQTCNEEVSNGVQKPETINSNHRHACEQATEKGMQVRTSHQRYKQSSVKQAMM